jgi:hypothetical protein
VSNLIIDGIEVHEYASLSIRQTYEELDPSSLLRLGNGAGVPQEAVWDTPKLSTSIQMSGTIPAGLDGIVWRGGVVIACAAARSIQSASNVIAIPANRRTDMVPYAQAVVAGGRLVDTTYGIVSNVATLAPVAGATAYRIWYYPLLTVKGNPKSDVDETGAAYSWSLDAEEL